jgi:hypothetical protein
LASLKKDPSVGDGFDYELALLDAASKGLLETCTILVRDFGAKSVVKHIKHVTCYESRFSKRDRVKIVRRTAFLEALDIDHEEIMKLLLLEGGATIGPQAGENPLACAIIQHRLKAIKLLVRLGAVPTPQMMLDSPDPVAVSAVIQEAQEHRKNLIQTMKNYLSLFTAQLYDKNMGVYLPKELLGQIVPALLSTGAELVEIHSCLPKSDNSL